MSKNKKYYKKNNYYKKPETKKEDKTYESLMQARVIDDTINNNSIDKLQIVKYIAVSVVLFAIIIGSLLLLRQM